MQTLSHWNVSVLVRALTTVTWILTVACYVRQIAVLVSVLQCVPAVYPATTCNSEAALGPANPYTMRTLSLWPVLSLKCASRTLAWIALEFVHQAAWLANSAILSTIDVTPVLPLVYFAPHLKFARSVTHYRFSPIITAMASVIPLTLPSCTLVPITRPALMFVQIALTPA